MTAVTMTAETVGFPTRLKEAASAAGLTVLLCMPIVFLHAEADLDGVLHPIPRPWPVAILAFLAFFGRLAALNFAEGRKRERVVKAAETVGWRAMVAKRLPGVGLAALFIYPMALLLILGSGRSLKWVDSYGIQILIYVMLGWGLNIVVGLAGLLDLGYVAFYAVGAYAYALLSRSEEH